MINARRAAIGGRTVAGGGFALGDFVFVMRKREVDAAGVDVQRVAQILHGHGGALDVPARSAGTDGVSQKCSPGFGRFP